MSNYDNMLGVVSQIRACGETHEAHLTTITLMNKNSLTKLY